MKTVIVKLFIFCSIINTLSSCTEKKPVDYAIISGELLNATDKEVGMGSMNYGITGGLVKSIRNSFSLDSEGKFVDTIYLKKDRDFIFYVDRSVVYVNLKPGDSLNLTAECENLIETIQYSGQAAAANTYMLKYFLVNDTYNKESVDDVKLNENEFIKRKDDYKKSIYDLLDSSEGLTESFINRKKTDLHYDLVSNYLYYAERHGISIGDESYKPSTNFLDIVSTVNMQDLSELYETFHYGLLLSKYYIYEYSKVGNYEEDDNGQFIEFLANFINDPKIKEEFLHFFGPSCISSTHDLQMCYSTLIQNTSKETYKREFLDIYNQLMLTRPGQISPLFTDCMNVDGTTSSLIDFRGKFVFINVWATWNTSSKVEIPYLELAKKKYHNIVFIDLSVDHITNIEQWKQFVKENNLDGIQLISDIEREDGFVKSYRIEGIPRFILIDPEGIIISENAPRPSDPLFDELLSIINI